MKTGSKITLSKAPDINAHMAVFAAPSLDTILFIVTLNTLKSEEKYVFEKTLMATETAKDPNSNTVFGQFYNADIWK